MAYRHRHPSFRSRRLCKPDPPVNVDLSPQKSKRGRPQPVGVDPKKKGLAGPGRGEPRAGSDGTGPACRRDDPAPTPGRNASLAIDFAGSGAGDGRFGWDGASSGTPPVPMALGQTKLAFAWAGTRLRGPSRGPLPGAGLRSIRGAGIPRFGAPVSWIGLSSRPDRVGPGLVPDGAWPGAFGSLRREKPCFFIPRVC